MQNYSGEYLIVFPKNNAPPGQLAGYTNIVFVYGLNGHRKRTWVHKNGILASGQETCSLMLFKTFVGSPGIKMPITSKVLDLIRSEASKEPGQGKIATSSLPSDHCK